MAIGYIRVERNLIDTMKRLSDELLIETFQKAKKFNLDPAFITLLEQELIKRKISLDSLNSIKN
ncbi:sporulation histidine kinase inhibitor Sda [Pseudogracilibacillus auburnensis]|uniref:sporulation histidine kinase inhibitor Sda n=1 Tax=Pseudogracilibacillus auburnensis TaxID=1494959 RepID=UPI00355770D5